MKAFPLLLGEGQGEGLAKEETPVFISRPLMKKKEDSLGSGARPSPQPSPKGRGSQAVI